MLLIFWVDNMSAGMRRPRVPHVQLAHSYLRIVGTLVLHSFAVEQRILGL